MNFTTYISLFLYLGTFIFGILLDIKTAGNPNSRTRQIYTVWLYIFLCFGYMTGSDWRNYEFTYLDGEYIEMYFREPLSFFLLKNGHFIIPDFWLFLGIVKCIYLYSVLTVLKKTTDYPFATTSILLNLSLAFMLISNPLRYMLALIPISFAMLRYIDGSENGYNSKIIIEIVGLTLIAICFHNSCTVFLLIFPLMIIFNDLSKTNRFLLIVLFIITIIMTSKMSFIYGLKNALNQFIIEQNDTIKSYEGYQAEDNSSIFAFGNILKIAFFCIILSTRDLVLGKFKFDKLCYSMALLYLFVDRFLLLIPTGFRLVIPLSYFFAAYVIFIFKSHLKYGMIFLIYFFVTYTKSLWNDYYLIPYSNSIYYICTDHLPYSERESYNLREWIERTGGNPRSK